MPCWASWGAVWVLGALTLPLSMGQLAIALFAYGWVGAAAGVLLISAVSSPACGASSR
ncbi:hypothetical protein [Phytohabitans kaempferiae]|uniref:Uncharacterized protein n=1 Tax=Phytohabitans kaempferiae TaxID=1620943 RepID=A0ABV6LW12_9ACTN